MTHEQRIASRFNALLALMVAFFAIGPFFEPGSVAIEAGRIAIVLTLLGAIWMLHPGRAIAPLVTAVLVVNELFHWLERISPDPFYVVGDSVTSLAFLAAAIGILSWTFWTSPRVGAGMLAGAASVYLLGGYFWGEAFGLLEFLEPGSFHGACAPRPDGASGCDATAASYPRLLYLSFVTLTTLGYGDLLPVTRAAEGVATLAALTGQLFLAVLIGRVVGGYVGQDPDAST